MYTTLLAFVINVVIVMTEYDNEMKQKVGSRE